jgi:hypothetical protein
MLSRRQLLRNVMMGATASMAGAAGMIPSFRARAAGECAPSGECVAGIRTEVFNMVDAKQRSTQWCWAACAQMILNYYNIPVTQEEIVLRIKGAFVDEAANYLEIVQALNGTATDNNGDRVQIHCQTAGVSTENIINDLYNDHPLLLAYNIGEGGHAVVLTAVAYTPFYNGYSEDYQLHTITIRDPWPDRPSRQVWNADDMAWRTSFIARVFVTAA